MQELILDMIKMGAKWKVCIETKIDMYFYTFVDYFEAKTFYDEYPTNTNYLEKALTIDVESSRND